MLEMYAESLGKVRIWEEARCDGKQTVTRKSAMFPTG
jgi:hypothetical protein